VSNLAPPSAVDLEQMVIASVFLSEIGIDEVATILSPSDFYDPTYKKVYKTMLAHHNEGKPMDLVAVEKDTEVNISALMDASSSRPEYHAKIIKEYSQRRYVGSKAPEIRKKAYDVTYNIFALSDEISKLSTHIENGLAEGNTRSALHILENPRRQGEQLLTGKRRLDEGLFEHNGLRRGTYTTVLADSGHGKTTFMEMIGALLIIHGHHVYWVQHENTEYVTSKHVMDFVVKHCPPDEVERALERLHVSDEIHEIQNIKREARSLHRNGQLDVIIDDYIQNTENRNYTDKVDIVMNNSMEYNKLKVELNCAVMVGSQVYIAKDRSKWNLEPRDTDVKYSQQVKQDSDLMLSVFRPIKVDSLQTIRDGEVYATDAEGNPCHKDSVFVKQVKVRGPMKYMRMHLIHQEHGLAFYDKGY
jgi:replicative DNA helicase